MKPTLCAALVSLGLTLAAAGCSQMPSALKPEPKKAKLTGKIPQPDERKVLCDGNALALNLPEEEPKARKAFLERFDKLLQEKRVGAARQWVERFPDMASNTLRDANSDELATSVIARLAEMHDAHLEVSQRAGSWSQLVARRREPSHVNYRKERNNFMRKLREGEFEAVGKINLIGLATKAHCELLEVDAHRLQGLAMLLVEQPSAGAAEFEKALAKSSATPLESTHILLLLSEARRRAGDNEGANEAWRQALVVASGLLANARPVADPTFWDRALYLQPVGIDWPSEVEQGLAALSQAGEGPVRSTEIRQVSWSAQQEGDAAAAAMLWTALGGWRLERGEGQHALVAFKRAETLAQGDTVNWLRLAQARTLAGLRQRGATTTVLMQLIAQNETEPVGLAAMAELGSIKVRDGAVNQGLSLLKKALEAEPAVEWPGRGAAEADYALALLMMSEESQGLEWLGRAQQRFEAEGETELLAKSLWNEAKFYEQTKKKDEMRRVQKRLEELEM